VASLLPLFKEVVDLLASLATILAVVLGGIWSYWLFRVRRHRHPRAEVTQTIVHKPLPHRKVLLNVVTTIVNSGEVLLPVKDGEVWVQQILPLTNPQLQRALQGGDDLFAALRNWLPTDDQERWQREIAWPRIALHRLQWAGGITEIEPGEKVQIQCDFILDQTVTLVRVSSLIANAEYSVSQPGNAAPRRWWKRWQRRRFIPMWDVATLYELTPPVEQIHRSRSPWSWLTAGPA
jgi:hypothetical protein